MTNKINSKKLESLNYNDHSDIENGQDLDGRGIVMAFPPSDREFNHGIEDGDYNERIDWDGMRMYLAHNRSSERDRR